GSDVRRTHRGTGADPRAHSRPGASVYRGPDPGDDSPRPEGQGARADSRRTAQPRGAPNRLRLRTALPVREAAVYPSAPVAARRGVRPRLPLSPGAGTAPVAARRPQQRRITMIRPIAFLVVAVLSLSLASDAAAEGTLRIGMTAADIPYTGGQTDNGF